jgi:hypothetical protein
VTELSCLFNPLRVLTVGDSDVCFLSVLGEDSGTARHLENRFNVRSLEGVDTMQ